VRDETGHLLAIACLYIYDGVLYFNGCVEETDYLDLIAPVEHAERGWTAVAKSLLNSAFPSWHALEFCNVPAASPTRQILPAVFQQMGLSVTEEVHEVCPVITLPATFDEYLESLPKKQRHEVRRKLRRAEAAGATVKVIGPTDDVAVAVDEFLELLQQSTLDKKDWLSDGRRAVFHDVASASLANGTLQLMFVKVEARKASALFNFHYRDRIWVYNSGLDPAAFGNLSLGVVVTAKAIEAAIEMGCSTFDFLRGSETYKYRFGAVDTHIYALRASRTPLDT
jgi:CelD/BcsL family acetyltransferase involved in cellulose biosynthesis